ncbi:hypothetical protein [Rhizosaccharibacter radicis]|uniref:Uncharacterized protein n=1 Tax=Rhizosaccharibacter radicis TaxID=2782605 RepID=A0ABT1VW53_9PROT|nr:hypothetical protein [Acetobacteraceae bacterium KSS12]
MSPALEHEAARQSAMDIVNQAPGLSREHRDALREQMERMTRAMEKAERRMPLNPGYRPPAPMVSASVQIGRRA